RSLRLQATFPARPADERRSPCGRCRAEVHTRSGAKSSVIAQEPPKVHRLFALGHFGQHPPKPGSRNRTCTVTHRTDARWKRIASVTPISTLRRAPEPVPSEAEGRISALRTTIAVRYRELLALRLG